MKCCCVLLICLLLSSCNAMQPSVATLQFLVHTARPEADLILELSDSWRGTDNLTGVSAGHYRKLLMGSSDKQIRFPPYGSTERVTSLRYSILHPKYVALTGQVTLQVSDDLVHVTVNHPDCHEHERIAVLMSCAKLSSSSVKKGDVITLDVYLTDFEPFLALYRESFSGEEIKAKIESRFTPAYYEQMSPRDKTAYLMSDMLRLNKYRLYAALAAENELFSPASFAEKYAEYLGGIYQKYGWCESSQVKEDYCQTYAVSEMRQTLVKMIEEKSL